MDVNFLHQHLGRLHYEEERIQEQLRNVTAYRKVFFQVYTAIKREAQHREANRMVQLKAILAQTIFSNPDLADSHTARVYYYRTLNLYHYAAQENERFYETGLQLIALLETQPHFLQENLSAYIAALSNLILSCGLMGKFEEVRVVGQLAPIGAKYTGRPAENPPAVLHQFVCFVYLHRRVCRGPAGNGPLPERGRRI